MNRENYFDHAATTPLDSRVLTAMRPWLEDEFANANSLHSAGLKARYAVERARTQVANALGVAPEEIVFTSGATEANNWVCSAFDKVMISPIEHSSVWERLRVGGLALEDGSADVVCLMGVNNETGGLYWSSVAPEDSPLLEREGCERSEQGRGFSGMNSAYDSAKRHCDITQAVGKIPIPLGFDFASFSAHKFYGPKGVGALYAKDALFPTPLLFGGEQEGGHRAGTLNVPAIVGMGVAAELASENHEKDFLHAIELKEIVLDELATAPAWQVNGLGPFPGSSELSPFILSLSFLGIEGESLVIELDQAGFAISSGAACSSRSNEPSHVLTALGVPSEWLRGTIRISFGRANTPESTRNLASAIKVAVQNLRNLA